jgi:hypothetical protein
VSRNVTDPQPLLFFAWLGVGLVSLITALVWLVVSPDLLLGPVLAPGTVAWTHLWVLGWLANLFFASGYQLTPVVTLKPLTSRWLARVHWAVHVVGFAWMVLAFLRLDYHGVAWGGSLVVSGFLMFVINLLLTSGWNPKWSHTSVLWTASCFWLLVGAALALVAVRLKIAPWGGLDPMRVLGLHVHVLGIGFFLQLLVAAASKLVPMFLLSSEKPQWGTWISGLVINLTLALALIEGLGAHAMRGREWMSWAVLGAVVAFLGQQGWFITSKRRKLDAAMVLFFGSCLLLLPSWAWIHLLHTPTAHASDLLHGARNGFFLLLGVTFAGCILGMAQKIVPFMLWHYLYARFLGKAQVPLTADLLLPWTARPILIAFIIASLLFLGGFLTAQPWMLSLAAGMLLLSLGFFMANGKQFLSHLKSPRIRLFGVPSSQSASNKNH